MAADEDDAPLESVDAPDVGVDVEVADPEPLLEPFAPLPLPDPEDAPVLVLVVTVVLVPAEFPFPLPLPLDFVFDGWSESTMKLSI